MSIPRIVELSGGLATGMLGIIVAVTIFKDDFDISRRLENEFRPLRELLVLLIFFTAPNRWAAFLLVVLTGGNEEPQRYILNPRFACSWR